MSQTNPNGANQYQLDPRQKLCWEAYVNPKSETFGNAYQSALKAEYEEAYARTITDSEWFREKVRRLNLVSKAEKVLDETLDLVAVNEEGRTDAALQRTKLDAAKFVAQTLGKDNGYSTRTETDVTTAGQPINTEKTPAMLAAELAAAKAYEEKLKESLLE